MGNFSRDTYRLTNAVHRLATGEIVADARHYVGVRMQQGVPVLDADLNELDEVRRREHEITVRELIGDGVPGQGDGFLIGPIEQPNDFAILPGMAVVGGWHVINLEPRRYSELPRFFDGGGNFLGTDLTTPGAERIDLVYLDAWEAEVPGTGPGADARLVNANVGVETAVRIERLWTVRVAEGALALSDVPAPAAGHKHLLLARLYRAASSDILPSMIEDRRRLGLTLSQALRAPMYVRRGSQVVDPQRFMDMLIGLREALATWQQDGLFPVVLNTLQEQATFANALNRVFYLATAAEVASLAGSLDNTAGLAVMRTLADAQATLIAVVRDLGTGVPADMAPIDDLEDLLEGDEPNGIGGLRPPLVRDDLLGAVRAQEALTTFLGLGSGEIPQGSVSSVLSQLLPPGPIQAGVVLTATYTITSVLSIPADSAEIFDLEPLFTDVQWLLQPAATQVSLMPGESADVLMTITPANDLEAGDFADVGLVAHARRRPEIQSPQPPMRLTIGELAPGASFFFYIGSTPIVDGELVLSAAQVAQQVFPINFRIVNTEDPESDQAFRVEHELVWPGVLPAGVNPANWSPNAPQTTPSFAVTSDRRTVTFNLIGPVLADIPPDVTFTLHAVVTLVSQDGQAVVGGKSNTVDLPIRVNPA